MFKTPSYLCDRCVYHFVGGQVCGDCNRGSKFVERVRFLKEGNETMYNQMYVSAARANGKSNMDLENYLKYLTSDCKSIESLRRINLLEIKKVVFNDPATIVFWSDGTKTVVKCGENDEYDPEKGLAMAIAKKALGNQGNYYETFKKWMPEEAKPKSDIKSVEEALDIVAEAAKKIEGFLVPTIDVVSDRDDALADEVKPVTKDDIINCLESVLGVWTRDGVGKPPQWSWNCYDNREMLVHVKYAEFIGTHSKIGLINDALTRRFGNRIRFNYKYDYDIKRIVYTISF